MTEDEWEEWRHWHMTVFRMSVTDGQDVSFMKQLRQRLHVFSPTLKDLKDATDYAVMMPNAHRLNGPLQVQGMVTVLRQRMNDRRIRQAAHAEKVQPETGMTGSSLLEMVMQRRREAASG